MKYTEQAFIKADEELSRRRSKANNEQYARISEISKIAPEIVYIDREIKSVNLGLLKAITSREPEKKASDIVMQIKENNKQAHIKKENILKKIGYPLDYLDTKYYCPKCMDRGTVNGVKCECYIELLQKYTYEERLESCEFDLHDFSEFKLEYYPHEHKDGDAYNQMSMILDDSIMYANSFSSNSESMLFIGDTGLGKTFLCSCIAKSVILKSYQVVFRSVLKVLEDILAEHYGKKAGDTMEELRKTDLLILDDLGSEFSDQSDPMLYQILNDRINLHKPTIVTTNLNAQQINSRYNERIFSRLFGEFKVYPFVGNDIRFEKKNM